MAASIFTGASGMRFLSETETDAFSPDNETTYATVRKLIEWITQWIKGTGVTGSVTTDPPNDTTGYLYDSAGAWSDDDYNTFWVLMTSGNGRGKIFEIDDTDGSSSPPKLICTGDNLYSEGIRSGDDYEILYDLNKLDSHTHDYIDSAPVENPTGRTLVCSHGVEASRTSGAWGTLLQYQIYCPVNPSTLRIYFQGKVGVNTGYVRLQFTDSGSNVFTGSGTSFTNTSYAAKTDSLDCSTADAGSGKLEIQTTHSTAGETFCSYLTVIWDT